jgi:adenylosuccinate lyase
MMYSTPELDAVWSDEYMLDLWRQIELAVLDEQERADLIPPDWYYAALHARRPDVNEWRALTRDLGHEVIAFLDLWGRAGADHVHIGLTSSDLTDTALGVRIRQSTRHLNDDLYSLQLSLLELARPTMVRLGRTHAQPAMVTTFDRWAAVYDEALERSITRLQAASSEAAVCKISGPVGLGIPGGADIERQVAWALGLRPAQASTQIVTRDRLAAYAGALGCVAGVLEAIAVELRLLLHAQIGEASLFGGVSSSAMPHKNNPTELERVCGLARIARGAFEPLSAGIAQWHERDMAHSSVERVLLPQAVGAVGCAARTLGRVIDRMHLQPARAAENAREAGLQVLSHRLMTHLQLGGEGYMAARRRTVSLLESPNLEELQGALRAHMHRGLELTPHEKEIIDGIL